MTLTLRPYQVQLLDDTRKALAHHRRVLMQLPTGGGKTITSGAMLIGAANKGLRSLFVVHRRELLEQTSNTLDRVGLPHGFCAAGFPPKYREPVTLCSVQTLASRMERLPKPDFVVLDEAHHAAAGTWRRVIEAFPDAFLVGLTATPQRLDGRGLDGLFKALVPGPSIAWLIEQGFLSKYRVWSHSPPNVTGVQDRGADFDPAALASVMDEPHILGDAVQHYREICPQARAAAFCVNVAHAKHTRDAFRAGGIVAEELDGAADVRHRKEVIRAFRQGEIKVLTSVDLFSEGFDLPELDAVIMLRPTKSLGLYLQQVGRCLRAAPGKSHAVILDHAGNVARHGLPDQEREWSLAGRKRRKSGSAPVKTCLNCFGGCPTGATVCVHCGHPFELSKREIDERDGALVEIDLEMARRQARIEVKQARTREQLEAIAAARGYKRAWVEHILAARSGGNRRAG